MGRNKENFRKAKNQGYHKLIFGKPSFDLLIDDKALFFKKDWYRIVDKYLKKFWGWEVYIISKYEQ